MPSKIGMNDIILSKMLKLNQRASDKITSLLKGDQPFASEKVDPDTILYAVNNIGYQDLADLQNEYPPEMLSKLRYEAFLIEQRRNKNDNA